MTKKKPVKPKKNTKKHVRKSLKLFFFFFGALSAIVIFVYFSLLRPFFLPEEEIINKEVENNKTYISPSQKYSVNYPNNWYTYEYDNKYTNSICTDFSDIPNPQDIPSKIFPSDQNIIRVCYSTGEMPSTFPYTNGSSENKTIEPYAVNDYTGIKGQQTSTLGLEDVVFLKNPQGGYVQITREFNAENNFNQILSTFKFTQ